MNPLGWTTLMFLVDWKLYASQEEETMVKSDCLLIDLGKLDRCQR